ncbi:MAG: Ppx/GppA phosphatase family protein [Firmicutes bacterium ADurb.Bin456]|nr:MAG: Ppx/GppA phosphatase family protein [Firmicutes bacterium ADurb.Bin456]
MIWCGEGSLRLVSINVGAVRQTGTEDQEGLRAAIGPALVQVRRSKAGYLVGVGGTVTTLAAMDQKLVDYDPRLIHGYTLTAERIRGILCLLASLNLEERKKMPGLQAARADIILAGVEIVLAVMEGLDIGCLVASESDLLEGLILEEF